RSALLFRNPAWRTARPIGTRSCSETLLRSAPICTAALPSCTSSTTPSVPRRVCFTRAPGATAPSGSGAFRERELSAQRHRNSEQRDVRAPRLETFPPVMALFFCGYFAAFSIAAAIFALGRLRCFSQRNRKRGPFDRFLQPG